MKNIILVGFMGTGKTAVSKRLAGERAMKFVSIDDLIEERENTSIKDIFEYEGEEYFREVEKAVVEEVSEGFDQVVDTGGGVVLDQDNMQNLKRNGIVICLWASPEVIYERTKRHGHRPLLNVKDPQKKIRELLEKRKRYYDQADYHIDTSTLNTDQVVSEIIEIIETDKKSGKKNANIRTR